MINWVDAATIVIPLAALLTIVVALAALFVSVWSVKQAKNTAHANTVSVFLAEYASKAMYEHLAALREFAEEGGPSCRNGWTCHDDRCHGVAINVSIDEHTATLAEPYGVVLGRAVVL